jgi:hypothetical protein
MPEGNLQAMTCVSKADGNGHVSSRAVENDSDLRAWCGDWDHTALDPHSYVASSGANEIAELKSD